MEGEVVTMQEIFGYRQDGVDTSGNVTGHSRQLVIRPKFADRLRNYGVDLPDSMFDSSNATNKSEASMQNC